jgi:peptide/nickel transport system substrate-binding protein
VSGGTLKLSSSQDPLCLDGGQVSTAAMQLLGRMVYDNLDALDANGKPTPWLARSWDITNGGTTYTFHLRSGVTFSDGTPFDAAAVVANFDHWSDPATKSPLAAAYIAPIKDTKVLGADTLQVDLHYPYSAFLNVLAQGWLGFVSPKQLADQSNAQICQAPIGTGPFVVDKYTPGEGLTLSKRKDYDWSASYLHHSGAAYLDAIDISFITEPTVRLSSLQSGEYDATDNIAPQTAASVKNDPSISYHNIARQGNPQRIILNTSRAPFNDLRVRQALAAGINVDGIAKSLGFGEYTSEHAFLSPTTADYDPSTQSGWTYDPKKAAKLLDAAGWSTKDAQGYRTKDGKRLTAYFPVAPSPTPTPINDLIQAEAKKLGVAVVIQQVTTAEAATARQTGDYDIQTGVWHTNTPDALYICYDSGEITTPQRIGQNTSRLSDPQLDVVLLKARQTTDAATQKKLYAEAQQRLEKLAPAIPLYDFYTPWAVRTTVHDVLADSSHGTPLFTIAWKGDS